jgi:tetratricopeptide (TPR) repeat protein
MKCALCKENKGKRGCHLSADQLICPVCCASTRNFECGACGYYQSATTYQRLKQLQSKKFITEINPELDDLCDDALSLVENGNATQGRAQLEELQRHYPDYHSVLYGLGVCCAMQDKFDDATSFLERAVEIYPLFEHAYYNLGIAYSKTLDLERSVQAYKAVISIDGEHGQVGSQARARIQEFEAMMKESGTTLSAYLRGHKLFDQGFLALQEKKYETAIGLFAQVLEILKDHVQSYGNMGLAYAILGEKQKALECLNKAIELDPEYEPAIMNRRAVLAAQEVEPVPALGFREISYYREFKLRGKSYIRQLANKLLPNHK